ncbi:BRO-N domain-containing protein [Insolitispirillum peregrinum]|uniref:BRO family, N-terminal domain n=1 Tax=Insolitispirillum peregrinum TaxID=80876 RepID=A0A1N7MFK4_9PROT|nr:Bro-N domain-containing protein [Insolitispirillum peregrinum]SIS84847.1 BRO family, N-terminal domain [Insolitispirillum peregrinum]
MSDMTPFDFEGFPVRILDQEGELWFVLADVCRVLELSNPSKAAERLDEDEKDTLTNREGIASPQVQQLTIINESGLYSLIFRSRKPEARRFKKWVTSEVLPTIRKTGKYAAGPEQGPSEREQKLLKELANLQHQHIQLQNELRDFDRQCKDWDIAIRMIKQGLDDQTVASAIKRHPTYAAHVRALLESEL